jgi:hypothetical protein
MKKFYRGSYIDASCQVWLHLVLIARNKRTKSDFDHDAFYCPRIIPLEKLKIQK